MIDNSDGSITLSAAEYRHLIAEVRLLERLFAAGVDSWDGYGAVQETDDSDWED